MFQKGPGEEHGAYAKAAVLAKYPHARCRKTYTSVAVGYTVYLTPEDVLKGRGLCGGANAVMAWRRAADVLDR